MSVKVYGAVSRYSKATGNARVVLQLLADAADDNGRIRIAVATLAQRANIDRSTVSRAVRRLVQIGEVVIESAGTGHTSTVYRAQVAGPVAYPGSAVLPTQGVQQRLPRVGGTAYQDGSNGSLQAAAREPEIDAQDEPAIAEFARCRPTVTNPRHVWARSLSDPERAHWRERVRPSVRPADRPVEAAAPRGPTFTPPGGWRAFVEAVTS